MKKELQTLEVKSQLELRQWLKKNHQQKDSLWLMTYKKVVPEYYLEWGKIVDELLCFGWIDSLPRMLDEKRKMLRISPRKPKSGWSKINRDKVAKLIQSGQMTKAGLAVIEHAKKSGSWHILKSTDDNKIPKDFEIALKKYPSALKNFKNFPPSTQRAILEWIALAKTTETRNRRILETSKLAEENIRANNYKKSAKIKGSISTLRSNPSDLMEIPGIGKTFIEDFERIKIFSQKNLVNKNPEILFAKLVRVNAKENHKTSKNYLYVIRLAVYFANGGRDPAKLKWSSWKSK